jgi:hypothetical protein
MVPTSTPSGSLVGREVYKHILFMGASTVKWTTLNPCSGLSESDPKLYTNFDFHE